MVFSCLVDSALAIRFCCFRVENLAHAKVGSASFVQRAKDRDLTPSALYAQQLRCTKKVKLKHKRDRPCRSLYKATLIPGILGRLFGSLKLEIFVLTIAPLCSAYKRNRRRLFARQPYCDDERDSRTDSIVRFASTLDSWFQSKQTFARESAKRFQFKSFCV